jgi:hypothetical protein
MECRKFDNPGSNTMKLTSLLGLIAVATLLFPLLANPSSIHPKCVDENRVEKIISLTPSESIGRRAVIDTIVMQMKMKNLKFCK